MNLAKFPRRGYVKEPTPIEYLPNLSKALGNKVNVYMKRDDLLPGCAGGNKTRKLDFAIADALAQGADTVITCGAVQSNHCRLTLAWAVHEGLDCHLVLEERVKGSYNPEASGNNFLYHLLGVKSITVVPGGSPMMEEMEKVAEKLRAQGKKPYIIPGGASNHIGALGYVSCAQEIMQQMFEMAQRQRRLPRRHDRRLLRQQHGRAHDRHRREPPRRRGSRHCPQAGSGNPGLHRRRREAS